MIFSIVRKVVIYVPNKLIAINDSVNKIINLPETAGRTFMYGTKVGGACIGGVGVGKGMSDVVEAIACQDGVCAIVSAINVAADGLQIFASFIPGPNVTAVVTMPISAGCKTFVWCCKRSRLPWGSC